MIRSILKGQRGGVAILTAMGFVFLSVPLISGSLGLSQTSNIDARVKADIMHRDYCGLGLQEYFNYLLMDTSRWEAFLSDNLDPNDPTKVIATVDVCGENLTLTVTQQALDPDAEPLGIEEPSVPDAPAYKQRDFQTIKTVSNSTPNGGDPVTYTINVHNRSSDTVTLTEIRDTLPAGFTYDCSNPDQLTLPGSAPQDVVPSNGNGCPSGSDVDWSMPAGTSIEAGEVVKLTFTAVTDTNPGTYCNEIQVVPGGNKTRSGKTAIVDIGSSSGLCPGEAVLVSQTMDYVNLVASDLTVIPFTYTLEVGYTLKVENIGTADLDLGGFTDLLPEGFSYFLMDQSGDITDAPFNLHLVPTLNRQQVTWRFNPAIPLASGTSQTLKFKTEAVNGQGVYWADLLVDFDGSFPEQVYTWPTAVVSIKDVYDVTATDEDGNEIVIDLQVWLQGENGLVATWIIK